MPTPPRRPTPRLRRSSSPWLHRGGSRPTIRASSPSRGGLYDSRGYSVSKAIFYLKEAGTMKRILRTLSLSAVLAAQLPMAFAAPQEAAANPAKDKFQADIKAAVLNGSITIPQLKELQANAEILKAYKANQTPGGPVDLLTPWGAVSKMKAVMASVKQPDRDTLEQDLQLMMATKQPTAVSTEAAPNPGAKLGKDIFGAVMHGNPTQAQVQTLQDSLNGLQSIKTSGEGKLQQFMALKKAKSDIEQTMDAGEFRPQDRQAVLNDLNSLGPQGGAGGGLRRGRS